MAGRSSANGCCTYNTGRSTGAESAFGHATALAVQQGSIPLEVQAICSLAAFCKEQGRTDEAVTRLGEVLDELNEGDDAPKLLAARHLMHSLRNPGDASAEAGGSHRAAATVQAPTR